MPRLLFEKSGNAVWISHLDLMRLFQRAFQRAGLPLTHTQGFNPRPSVSIALPLSVGVQSCCELLDFELEENTKSNAEIRDALNASLIPGVYVRDVYSQGRKIRDLALLDCTVTMIYDGGVPVGAVGELTELFTSQSLTVAKRTKNGVQEQDIIPMIRSLTVHDVDEKTVAIRGLVCCQNPTLNPMQLVAAIENYKPHLKPDFSVCRRNEIFDNKETVFR